jgi:gamma-glutamyltranspeptidase/glutathione hydrolase
MNRRTLFWALLAVSWSVLDGAPTAALRARRGMVAAEHELASLAGVEILRRGGNAVDAAVATALAAGVANPSSCGIGGGGFMVIFERASGRVFALDYREAAPAAADRDMFVRNGAVVPGLSTEGGLAVAVPGEMAGVAAALRRFGTMPLDAVAAPAIRLAREGFPVGAHLAGAIDGQREAIARHPDLARLLLRADGTPPAAGATLRQLDLARTLEGLTRSGAETFYRGGLAAAIAAAVARSGGVVQVGDLESYRPLWREPVRGRWAGHDIYGMPPPSSGGGVLMAVLHTIAADDLRTLGHNSPTYLHLLAESLKYAFADRAAFYGDPAFFPVPLPRLVAPASGRAVRRRVRAYETREPSFYGRMHAADDAGTSHLSVVDEAGNAVALTTSVNTAFGSKVVVPGTGIILNNTMDDFSALPGVPNTFGLVGSEANAVAAGKRPLSSMSPTVVVRAGEARAVAGGSGGPLIITGTLQVLLNALVFDMDAEEAVAAPRLHHQWMPPVLMLEEGTREIDAVPLQRIGHAVRRTTGGAAIQFIQRTADGWLDGAADPRKGGRAAGW